MTAGLAHSRASLRRAARLDWPAADLAALPRRLAGLDRLLAREPFGVRDIVRDAEAPIVVLPVFQRPARAGLATGAVVIDGARHDRLIGVFVAILWGVGAGRGGREGEA